MRAIILAAGRGSRMGALTGDRPKCLVELQGRPLLDWQLRALRGAGLGEIGIVTGYRREALARADLTELHNPRWAESNMVVSLACAAAWLRESACIVAYSDIVYRAEIVAALAAAPAGLAISYDLDWLESWSARFADPLADAESFRVAADGRLLEIGRRVEEVSQIQGQYMGLLKIAPAGWEAMERSLARLTPAERDRLDMTGLLRRLIGEGVQVGTVAVHGGWAEIDSDRDLALAASLLARGALPAWPG